MDVLIVEDEAAISDFLKRRLEAEGYSVTTASDGIEGERLALQSGVDVIILDRMLPKRDGIEVLAAIRRVKPSVPVILLSAKREIAERVEGLDGGATDYICKPFAFEELLARVRTHLRQPGNGTATVLVAGGLRLDLIGRRVERGPLAVRLPDREANLLAYLMQRAGQVCTRSEILAEVWGYDHDPGTMSSRSMSVTCAGDSP